jgi:hypothetical protein
MDDKSSLIGIICGIGSGVLLGSEFAGRYATLAGAILLRVSLFSMGVWSHRGRINNL